MPDQTTATVARLLVVSQHGVPAEILPIEGRSFLSKLLTEVGKLLSFHKLNTSAYIRTTLKEMVWWRGATGP